MQGPPVVPDAVVGALVPIFGMLTGIVIVGFVTLGPVGRAIGDVVRHVFGAHRREAGAVAAGELEEVRERLDGIGRQLGELADRQDFAERMLAQVRREKAIAGGSDAGR